MIGMALRSRRRAGLKQVASRCFFSVRWSPDPGNSLDRLSFPPMSSGQHSVISLLLLQGWLEEAARTIMGALRSPGAGAVSYSRTCAWPFSPAAVWLRACAWPLTCVGRSRSIDACGASSGGGGMTSGRWSSG